jgi:hypothetical protein
LKKRLIARQKVLDDCAFQEMREIRKKSVALSIEALGANSAGWWVYIIPLMAVGGIYKSIERRIRALISLSDPDLEKIAPDIRHDGAFAL